MLADCETNEGIGALVLTRKGRIFWVRLDLGLIQKAFADLDYFVSIVQRMNRLIARIETLPIPAIAAINGFTRASGFESSLGCYFIIVADEAKLDDVYTAATLDFILDHDPDGRTGCRGGVETGKAPDNVRDPEAVGRGPQRLQAELLLDLAGADVSRGFARIDKVHDVLP